MDDLYSLNKQKLGFGFMRLPMKDGEIDLETVNNMVDMFMSRGYTYFDTAYPYHDGKSETMLAKSLVARYPRESFTLADKFTFRCMESPDDMQRIFDIQLKETGAGYFDFYLFHALRTQTIEGITEFGGWDFVLGKKRQGLVKHIGCSFHDKADVLDALLTAHPELEFVQLQINYADWESPNVQSRLCYEVARKHGKPVVIMEPIKGGSLSSLPDSIRAVFEQENPVSTPSEFALRFAGSLDGVLAVLSGMSTLEQVEQNTALFKGFAPLSEREHAVIEKVAGLLSEIPTVPCTACKYCVAGCPCSIPIPSHIAVYNSYKTYNFLQGAKNHYLGGKDNARASECIACGACSAVCPQGIDIPKVMGELSAIFD